MKKYIIILTIILTIIPTSHLAAGPGPERACRDVQFLFVRGSGATHDQSAEYQSFLTSINQNSSRSQFTYEVSDLDYPAVSVDNFGVLLSAFVSAGTSGEFAKSVETGTQNLYKFYQTTMRDCPATKWVLFGYSQGAKVIAAALEQLNPDHIVYVAMFGDPSLYLPEGEGFNPPACQGRNFSHYRAYVPNCHTDDGIFGARKPYVSSSYIGKIGLWCNDKDLICGSSKNLFTNSGHLNYSNSTGIPSAVDLAVKKLQQILPTKVTISTKTVTTAMDTAILIDATGSMSPYASQYKTEAIRLAKITLSSGGRIALFAYRDLSDATSLVKLCDFSCSLSQFTSKLHEIDFIDGGDTPESLLSASLNVMKTLPWQTGATKSIITLTDAPYHNPDRDGTTLRQVADLSLSIDPVNFFIITESRLQEDYCQLAELTGGQVFSLGEMSAATDYVISRPVAIFPQENYYGLVGDSIRFDASASYGIDAPISHYDWDTDGDGIFEITHHGAVIELTYRAASQHFVVVRAVSSNGTASTMSAQVSVTTTPPAQTSLSAPDNLAIKNQTLTWQSAPSSAHNLLTIDGAILGLIPASTTAITLTDLNPAADHTITLTSVDAHQNLGRTAALHLAASSPQATIQTLQNSPTTPKIPATGAKPQPKPQSKPQPTKNG